MKVAIAAEVSVGVGVGAVGVGIGVKTLIRVGVQVRAGIRTGINGFQIINNFILSSTHKYNMERKVKSNVGFKVLVGTFVKHL